MEKRTDKSHALYGADLPTLWRVWRRSRPVAPGRRLLTAGAFGAAAGRLPFSLAERAYVAAKRTAAKRKMQPPIFILGHWRSGTTHLYNVLTRAPQFAYVSPFATALPWDFLLLGRMLEPMLERKLPERRYIDNIPVHGDSPQEDEIALANMSPLSFYHALYFPRDFQRQFDAGIFLDGVSERERARWEDKLLYLYAKLQIAQPARRLLIKNPVYTARVDQLRKLWPDAKFIHIHRNPYKVFVSMRNFYDALFKQFALQPYDHVDIDGVILGTYERMMARLKEHTADLPPERFVEMRFDEFQADPLGQIRSCYDRLGLSGFDAAEPAFRAYLDQVSNYQKNRFDLTAQAAARVRERWHPFIEDWGYSAP